MLWWTEVLLVLLITGASLFAFYELAQDVNTSEKVARFDASVSDWLEHRRLPWLDRVMKVFTYAGGTIGVTTLTFILVFYLIEIDRIGDARFTALLVIGGAILANALKPVLKRVRPADDKTLISKPRSSSFPSGHSMASMCLALAASLAVAMAPSVSTTESIVVVILCIAYAFLVGVSRVYLGVHWPSDVLAAWLLGCAWVTGATGVALLLFKGLFQLGVVVDPEWDI
jgi:undecaprenyl-diphosphatase